MGQALYRKYRSKSLKDVVGQEHVTTTLGRALEAGQVSHAYLFTGPRGVGKTSVARILAHMINDLVYGDDQHLDIIEIDAASNRRIDDIRDLREKVHIAPINAKYKVYIIDEVHMLTSESFNALLKTLEEPPAHVVFILATTESHKLPATIISRTQRFAFRPASVQQITEHLRSIAAEESIHISDDALAIIAEHSDGSFRDSISLLDQLGHITGDKPITQDDVISILGLAPQAQIQKLADAVINGNHAVVSDVLRQLQNSGTSAMLIVAQLNKTLADAAVSKPELFELISQLLEVPKTHDPMLKLLTTLVLYNKPTISTPPGLTVPDQGVSDLPQPESLKPVPPARASQATPRYEVIAIETPTGQALADDSWSQILDQIKTKSTILQATLKQSTPFIAEGGVLQLRFKTDFHRKKADVAAQKEIIADAVKAVTGQEFRIELVTDKGAQSVTPTSSHVNQVADIMGGGEVIDEPHL